MVTQRESKRFKSDYLFRLSSLALGNFVSILCSDLELNKLSRRGLFNVKFLNKYVLILIP